MQYLQLSALVPAWLRELCPSVMRLALESVDLPTAPPSRPAPALHHSLQTLLWRPLPSLDTSADPIRRHVRQQLAALPSLASLTARDVDWAARPALISSSLTRLELFSSLEELPPPLRLHLAAQFPNLVELDGIRYLMVHDEDFHALLRLPHLRTLKIAGLALQYSARGRPPWPQHLDLHVSSALVDTFALLPLDSIPRCTVTESMFVPSLDAARAQRVAAAFRRWGALRVENDGSVLLRVTGLDVAALLASLPPFLRAVQQPVTLGVVVAVNLTPDTLRRLAALLTPNVRTLRFIDTSFAPDTWPALLPILPPSVDVLDLVAGTSPMAPMVGLPPLPSVEQLRSLCLGAVRPVRVRVAGPGAEARVQHVLAGMGEAPLVSLEAADKL